MKFNPLMPELYVTDFQKSLDFYTNTLGFTYEYGRAVPRFAFLSYGDSQLMIQELVAGEKEKMGLAYPFGRGINFEIRTPDIDVLASALREIHYPLMKELREYWRDIGVMGKESGSKEFTVQDPDGYELRFAQDLGEREITASQQ